MKIVLIGGGSYVFAPMAIYDAIAVAKLNGGEMVLVDLDEKILEAMKNFAVKIAETEGINIRIEAETDRYRALPGADFVVLSAAVQGAKRWLSDMEILKKYGIAHQNRECGGVGGLSYTVRSVALAMDICADIQKLCPNAIFLDVSNPMPRVVNAINNYTDTTAFGFCSIAWNAPDGYRWFANLLGKSKDEISVVTAGINHFAWLVSITEKATGRDLYGDVVKRIYQNKGWESDMIKKWYEKYGAVIAGAVGHHAEYLPYDPDMHYADHPPFHGSGEERQRRIESLIAAAEGKTGYHNVLEGGSWEHPILFADILYNKKTEKFDLVNVRNKGYITELPDGLTVEVPVYVENGKVIPEKVKIDSENLIKVLQDVGRAQDIAAKASVIKDTELLKYAVDEDIAVLPEEKERAKSAIIEIVKSHNDIIHWF